MRSNWWKEVLPPIIFGLLTVILLLTWRWYRSMGSSGVIGIEAMAGVALASWILTALLLSVLIYLALFFGVRSLAMARQLADRLAARDKQMFEQAAEPMVVIDTEGVFLSVNAASIRLLGYPISRVVGKHITELDFLNYDQVQNATYHLKRIRDGHLEPFEFELRSRAGGRTVVEIRASAIREMQTIIGYQLILHDITSQRLAEEALKASEERYRGLFENMLDGEAYCQMLYDKEGRGDDFVYLEVNKQFEPLTGLRDVVGKKVTEVIPGIKDTNPEIFEIYGRVANGGEPEKFESNLSQIGRWLRVSAFSPAKGYFVAVFNDISGEKKAIQALEKSEYFFKESQKAASTGSYYLDVATGVWESSEVLDEIFGIDEKYDRSVAGWLDIVHPEDRKMMESYFTQEVIGAQNEFNREYRIIRRSDGETRWVLGIGELRLDSKGKVVSMIGTVQDITQRKLYEQELAREKAKDDALLQGMGEGMVAMDTDLRITFVNARAEKMFNLGDGVGKRWEEVVQLYDGDGKPIDDESRPTVKALRTGKISSSSEEYYKNDQGKLVPLLVVASPIMEGGQVKGVVGLFRDITKEKEVDRAKTEFVSLASHQLRTPLSIIKWYTEIMLDEKEAGKLTEGQRKFLEQIYTSGVRMVELVNALLNVSRIEMGSVAVEPVESSLPMLSDQVIAEIMPKIEAKQLTLTKDYGEGLTAVLVDPRLYQLVFQNLMTNSVKYTPVGKSITVKVEDKNGEVVVSVKDSGVGIPAGLQSQVFTKLFRAENAKAQEPDGTGLGLYLAKSVVESYGGRIWFDSEENKGSTFYFTVPKGGMKRVEGSKSLI